MVSAAAIETWHATRTIQLCREACGGAGYLQENRLPHLKADTDVFTTFEGDNTVLLQLVAKGLLTGYRDAFGSLEGWGKVGFIADMVRETVLERTAARALIARLIDAGWVERRDQLLFVTSKAMVDHADLRTQLFASAGRIDAMIALLRQGEGRLPA